LEEPPPPRALRPPHPPAHAGEDPPAPLDHRRRRRPRGRVVGARYARTASSRQQVAVGEQPPFHLLFCSLLTVHCLLWRNQCPANSRTFASSSSMTTTTSANRLTPRSPPRAPRPCSSRTATPRSPPA